ncbi:hypothetical protein BOTBODRAFT_26316 [Botryobasidium botryosum FD-172 SS1]|uniref:FK506-binding protein n=1 Tax=Botryobasidium botryosum (strain FD-172 SS1) TaxID=930990 RepID=A0A067N1N4_BOTB1|nr:hypothetical protein BOTBODRAFT_26316 [Botryobasidium botryosum FD-172 SS1]
MIAIALWSIILEPGKKYNIVVQRDFRISLAALGESIVDEGRSCVKVSHAVGPDSDDEEDDEEEESTEERQDTIIASLIPGKIEAQQLDLVFVEQEDVILEVTGKNAVYLTGNYIEQGPSIPYDSDDEDSDEEGYGLDEVSSDVEVSMGDIDQLELGSEDDESRFEELDDAKPEPANGKKRKTTDAMDEDEAPAIHLSKSQKKKLKAAGGLAIPAGEGKKEKKAEVKKDGAKKEAKKDEPKKAEVTKKDGKKDGKEAHKEKKEGKDKKSGKKYTTPSGLVIEDHFVGDGPAARIGQRLKMRYILKLDNGKVIDKNTAGTPFAFRLGKGEVIKGWDEGLVGMTVGSERKLTVPSALGYGRQKIPDIPPNSTLHFEVKLLGVN